MAEPGPDRVHAFARKSSYFSLYSRRIAEDLKWLEAGAPSHAMPKEFSYYCLRATVVSLRATCNHTFAPRARRYSRSSSNSVRALHYGRKPCSGPKLETALHSHATLPSKRTSAKRENRGTHSLDSSMKRNLPRTDSACVITRPRFPRFILHSRARSGSRCGAHFRNADRPARQCQTARRPDWVVPGLRGPVARSRLLGQLLDTSSTSPATGVACAPISRTKASRSA